MTDEIKQDTLVPAWIPARRSFGVHEHVVMSLPYFSTIEKFLLVGGKANDIYDRMMSLAYPKGSNLVQNIMNELQNKSSRNLNTIWTITGFTGLYDLHDNIFYKKYKGASDLIFWVKGSFELHNIVNRPNSIKSYCKEEMKEHFTFLSQCIL